VCILDIFSIYIDIHLNTLYNANHSCAIKMSSISIGSGGKKLPLVGFGLWRIDNDCCSDAVYNAIKAGYRMFDGACGI
jgi:hypothetical protein